MGVYRNSVSFLSFSFQFWQPSTRGKTQIWLNVTEKSSRHFLEPCYALVTSKNPIFKYGNSHVFLLRMCGKLNSISKESCGSNNFCWKEITHCGYICHPPSRMNEPASTGELWRMDGWYVNRKVFFIIYLPHSYAWNIHICVVCAYLISHQMPEPAYFTA